MGVRIELLCLALVLMCTLCTEAAPSVFKFEQTDRLKLKVKSTCGYEGCELGKDDMLNVHLVPHTHDDVGWLKTVDQYYYGGVQYILDTVIMELRNDPKKRFIYVEIAFFWRWWNEQHDSIRHVVKGLVNEGRLEFILGGWCMNDEASTHYTAIIDQHAAGFFFLERNFGDCARPKIGWQIDPFGHSREQASLFAQFGFDGLFFGRLDYQDKEKRLKDKTMELVWMGSENLGDQGALFTGVNYNGYGPPPGFDYDQHASDQPIMDDERLEDYNVDDVVKAFLKAAKDQASNFTTNHIMMTMGSDFQYQNAHQNFKNLDKLIYYVNQAQEKGSKVNTFYSTPSCYLYALNQVNQTYTKKEDDFFPYASNAHQFWTGYFTSRPALKGYVRETNNFFQTVKQLDTLSQLEAEFGSNIKLDRLRRAMGVAQHHDAVSGTEKQHVADDYAKRLAYGVASCQEVVNSAYSKLMPVKPKTEIPPQAFCNLLNVSYCPASEGMDKFTVTVYNPMGRPVNSWIRVPVTKSAYTVVAPNMDKITHQIVPVSDETKKVPAYNGSKSTGELVFWAELPALGFKTYFVQAAKGDKMSTVETPVEAGDITIKNEHLSLTFDGTSGLLKSMTNLDKKLTHSVEQTLLYYKSYAGNGSKPEFQSSGAYVFRPNGTEPEIIGTGSVKTTKIEGDLVQEVHQVFSDWASQVVRLYKGEKYAEFEWTVGPIPFKDGIGKEIISRFTTDMKTASTFYTDSNGREMLKRVRDFRPTWDLNQTEPVAGNYYPVNSRIYLREDTSQFTVLTDRSQGGASIKDGQLELMVHRRMFMDDHYGVGEPLNETGISGLGLVVRGKHYVLLDTVADSGQLHRDLAMKVFMAPTVTFASLTSTPQDYNKTFKPYWSGLKKALPDNVHLLTLEQWKAATFLLRLEHFYEKNEDATLSKPATVSLKGLFEPFVIDKVVELTLGANVELEDAKRLPWNVAGMGSTRAAMADYVTPVTGQDIDVMLQPMQIRTFQVHIYEP